MAPREPLRSRAPALPAEHQVLPPPPAVPARSRHPTCAADIAGPQAEVLTYLLLFHHAPVHPLALSSGSTPGEGLPALAPGRAARIPLTAARDLRAHGSLCVCAPPSSQGWNWGSSFCYFPSNAPGTWLAFRAASVRKNQRWPDGLMAGWQVTEKSPLTTPTPVALISLSCLVLPHRIFHH